MHNMKLFRSNIFRLVIFSVGFNVCLLLFSSAGHAQVYDLSTCSKLKGFKTAFERSGRNKDVFFDYKYEFVRCPAGVSILRKYAFDKNNRVRETVLDLLRQRPKSLDVLKIIVDYINKHPDEDEPIFLAHFYSCRFFRSVRSRQFTKTLIDITKTEKDGTHGNEIYLLGCQAKFDRVAFDWLEKLSDPKWKSDLSPGLRESQLPNVAYARAEMGIPDAVKTVLSDIEEIDKRGNFNHIAVSLLERTPQISNCTILDRLSNFITDKRGYSNTSGSGVASIRISEKAVEMFTYSLGETATGARNGEWKEKLYSDEELERIQSRVRSHLRQGCKDGSIRN
mgnify:FL=1